MYSIQMYDESSLSWTDIYYTSDNNIVLYMYYKLKKKYKNYFIRVVEVLQSNEVELC